MRITNVTAINYRTLEDVSIDFPNTYTAICGKNNAGKSNVIRLLRYIFADSDSPLFSQPVTISRKRDFPAWKTPERDKQDICVTATIALSKSQDSGIIRFISTIDTTLDLSVDPVQLKVEIRFPPKDKRVLKIQVAGRDLAEYQAQEVLTKLRSSSVLLFHNSTEYGLNLAFRRTEAMVFGDFNTDARETISKKRDSLFKTLHSQIRKHQQELTEVLGRLSERYDVGLSFPSLEFEKVPIEISLGEKEFGVPLDNWGSGTKNKTLIIMNMITAKRSVASKPEAERIAPFIVIEEPECFLHPSAQGEFGRLIQDLAEELQIQVIVSSHSPYLLSHRSPDSNVLLDRVTAYRKLRGTTRVDISGDNWREPFELSLGSSIPNIPNLVFGISQPALLVEGELDKEYLSLLRADSHGTNSLQFQGEILPYGGIDNLKHQGWLKFVLNLCPKAVITMDLDLVQNVKPSLEAMGLQHERDYIVVGMDKPGLKNIEGLIPPALRAATYAKYPDLLSQISAGTTEERKSATSLIKKYLLEDFKSTAKPGADYADFYKLVKKLNKMLSGKK